MHFVDQLFCYRRHDTKNVIFIQRNKTTSTTPDDGLGFHATRDASLVSKRLYYTPPSKATSLPFHLKQPPCTETQGNSQPIFGKLEGNVDRFLQTLTANASMPTAPGERPHMCSLLDAVQSHRWATAQTLRRDAPRYQFSGLLTFLPLRYHTLPQTRCRKVGGEPEVHTLPKSGCARVSIKMRCMVEIQVPKHRRGDDDDDDASTTMKTMWIPLDDPVLLAWSYGPRDKAAGGGSLVEAHVEQDDTHDFSKSSSKLTVRFDTCTPGRHALHVRLEYLSRRHAIAEIDQKNLLLPPATLMRKTQGSPYAIDVNISPPSAPPLDRRPSCELGLAHAPTWTNETVGSRNYPMLSQKLASFRWYGAARTMREAAWYHMPNSTTTTHRFAPVFHMGQPSHRVRATFHVDMYDDMHEFENVAQTLEKERMPYPDKLGGFYQNDWVQPSNKDLGDWLSEIPRLEYWDRFEATPHSPCKLCRFDYNAAMKCANRRPVLIIGDSTGDKLMHYLECAQNFGSWEHNRDTWRRANDTLRNMMRGEASACTGGPNDSMSTCRLNDLPAREYESRDDALVDYPCLGVMPAFARDDDFKVLYSSLGKFLDLPSRQFSDVIKRFANPNAEAVYPGILNIVRKWHSLLRAAYGAHQGIVIVVSAGVHDAAIGYSHRGGRPEEGAYMLFKALYEVFTLPDDKVVFALPNAIQPLNTLARNCALEHKADFEQAVNILQHHHDYVQNESTYAHGLDPRMMNGGFMWPYPSCTRHYHYAASAERGKEVNDRIYRRVVDLNRERQEAGHDRRVVSVVDWREPSILLPEMYDVGDDVHPTSQLVDELLQLVFHGMCGCDAAESERVGDSTTANPQGDGLYDTAAVPRPQRRRRREQRRQHTHRRRREEGRAYGEKVSPHS
ncbi:DUF285 domain-containing protein [Pseudoscourfieldia marina]